MGKGVSPVKDVDSYGDGDNNKDIGAKEEEDEEEGTALAARFSLGP